MFMLVTISIFQFVHVHAMSRDEEKRILSKVLAANYGMKPARRDHHRVSVRPQVKSLVRRLCEQQSHNSSKEGSETFFGLGKSFDLFGNVLAAQFDQFGEHMTVANKNFLLFDANFAASQVNFRDIFDRLKKLEREVGELKSKLVAHTDENLR